MRRVLALVERQSMAGFACRNEARRSLKRRATTRRRRNTFGVGRGIAGWPFGPPFAVLRSPLGAGSARPAPIPKGFRSRAKGWPPGLPWNIVVHSSLRRRRCARMGCATLPMLSGGAGAQTPARARRGRTRRRRAGSPGFGKRIRPRSSRRGRHPPMFRLRLHCPT